jgi:hypothetical protein
MEFEFTTLKIFQKEILKNAKRRFLWLGQVAVSNNKTKLAKSQQ